MTDLKNEFNEPAYSFKQQEDTQFQTIGTAFMCEHDESLCNIGLLDLQGSSLSLVDT